MKKIVAMGAIAALAGGMIFADEPAVDIKLAEFNGNATAKWGVDLDAGQTGFTNTEGDLNIKLNLWNEGEKSTTGDGIWGEIKIKGKALAIRGKDGRSANNVEITTKSYIDAADVTFNDNGSPADDSDDYYELAAGHLTKLVKKDGDKFYIEGESTGKMKDWDGDAKVELDTAKIHFGDKFYIGIKKGDAQVGEYKFDGAIRSADNDNAKWLLNVGPDKYSQGIVLGYGDDNFGLDIDLRSYFDDDVTHTNYTGAYAFAAEAQLKDTNSFVSGLSVDVGAGYNISDKYYIRDKDDGTRSVEELYKVKTGLPAPEDEVSIEKAHILGYTARVGYKFSLDEKKYLKPVVGLTGTYSSGKLVVLGNDIDVAVSENNLVAGVMFGLGETKDSDPGVYFLDDGDQTKKITPGFSVIAAIPFASTAKMDSDKKSIHDRINAIIVPSVYLNSDVVEGLKLAAYSEMALLKKYKADDADNLYDCAEDDDRTFALALAAGAAYDIKSGDLTITPKVGVRFANQAYFENKINERAPLSNHKIFEAGYGKLGVKEKTKDSYLNLKAGVDVNGLIDNTTVFVEYSSANLLNTTDYATKHYDVKLGTFNVGAKIHF